MKMKDALAFALNAESVRAALRDEVGEEEYLSRTLHSRAFLLRIPEPAERLRAVMAAIAEKGCGREARRAIIAAWIDAALASRPAGEDLHPYLKRHMGGILRAQAKHGKKPGRKKKRRARKGRSNG